ncbi:hypothetical protein B1A_05953, partial [mine drainage metagenome]
MKTQERQHMASTPEGKITQIIGPVIDVEFPRDALPHVYDALKVKDHDLTLEVQQDARRRHRARNRHGTLGKGSGADWRSSPPALRSRC